MSERPRPIAPETLTEMELVYEPEEQAFSILMPKSWRNEVALQRDMSLNRVITRASSPSGDATIYFNDQRIPMFIEPGILAMPPGHPLMQIRPYMPAEPFFQQHVQFMFSGMPGFRVIELGASGHYQHIKEAELRRLKLPGHVTAAAIVFEHAHPDGSGRAMRTLLHGATVFNPAHRYWMAELVMIAAVGDPRAHEETAMRMRISLDFNPQWYARQIVMGEMQRQHSAAMHQQTMQHLDAMAHINTMGHIQRMQGIAAWGAANTAAHQARMDASDARHQSWLSSQAQIDSQHRSWMQQQHVDDHMQQARINAINEQHTVADATGATYQVDIHHERYYVNPQDNTYIGVSATTEPEDLRRLYGLDPEQFREVKILR